jgi:hypothetical protein
MFSSNNSKLSQVVSQTVLKLKFLFIICPWSTHPAHVIFLHLIALLIFCEEYKLLSSSECSFLQPLVAFSLIMGPYVGVRRFKEGVFGGEGGLIKQ